MRAHFGTGEWSAQGVGRTVAGVVEAAERGRWVGVLADREWRGEEVPVLSAMVKVSVGEAMEGRVVGVERVVGRWCRIEDWRKTGEEEGDVGGAGGDMETGQIPEVEEGGDLKE